MAGPAALVVPALKKHTATVIFAHGLGDSGAGWYVRYGICILYIDYHRSDLARNWRRRGKFEEVTFIFPNAPQIPITVVSTAICYIRLPTDMVRAEFWNENAGLV